MASGFEELLRDLFAPIAGVSLRRMFGGLGVFRDGLMFALVSRDVLYFKADPETEPAFRAEGCGPLVYDGMKGRSVTMPYWRVPERLLDEPEEFRQWAESAIAVAGRAEAAKTGSTRKSRAGKRAAGGQEGARTGRRRKSGT